MSDQDPKAPVEEPASPTEQEPTPEPEPEAPPEGGGTEQGEEPQPEKPADPGSPPSRFKGRTDTALQKLQMEVANLKKGDKGLTADDVAAVVRKEFNDLLGSSGASEAADATIEGIDPDEPLTGRAAAKLIAKAKTEAMREYEQQAQQREEARRAQHEEAEESRQEFLGTFDEGKPEHMKGQGPEVLKAFDKRMSRFKSIDRLNKADQEAIEDEQYRLAFDEVEKKVKSGKKAPSRKSPEGTDIVKPGASTTTTPPDGKAGPKFNEFGVPVGLAEDWEANQGRTADPSGL